MTVDNLLKLGEKNNYILSQNIRSLGANFTKLEDLINELKGQVSIIALQEIWKCPDRSLFRLPGFQQLELKTREVIKTGGGVGFWVDNDLEYELLPDSPFIEKNLESIFIKVKGKRENLIIGNIYRSPSGNKLAALDLLMGYLEKIHTNYKGTPLIICGDFNIDFLKPSRESLDWIEAMLKENLALVMTAPTRVTNKGATMIDAFFTRKEPKISGTIASTITDHYTIIMELGNFKTGGREKKIFSRDLREKSILNLKRHLAEIKWEQLGNDTLAFDKFDTLLLEALNKYCPFGEHKLKYNTNPISPWMTHGLMTSRKQKK